MGVKRRPQSELRKIKRGAKAEMKTVETKKERLRRELGGDPFQEVDVRKKYLFGLVKHRKSGLLIAPTDTWKIGNVMVRVTVDSLIVALLGYVLKIKDWRVRSKKKPPEAKGNYIFTLNKYHKCK